MDRTLLDLLRYKARLDHKLLARNVFYNKHFPEWTLEERKAWLEKSFALANAKVALETAMEEMKQFLNN